MVPCVCVYLCTRVSSFLYTFVLVLRINNGKRKISSQKNIFQEFLFSRPQIKTKLRDELEIQLEFIATCIDYESHQGNFQHAHRLTQRFSFLSKIKPYPSLELFFLFFMMMIMENFLLRPRRYSDSNKFFFPSSSIRKMLREFNDEIFASQHIFMLNKWLWLWAGNFPAIKISLEFFRTPDGCLCEQNEKKKFEVH